MNDTASVAYLDDQRLIRDGEQAVDLYNKDVKNARSRIMPMACGLCAAKRMYPATQAFGDWLHTSSYREIEHQDRAALIKIGENEDFAAKYVRTTSLTSPQTIWDAIRELRPSYYDSNSAKEISETVETDAAAFTTPVEPLSTAPKVTEKEISPPQRHALAGTGTKGMKNPERAELIQLLGIAVEQFTMVFSAYPYNRQRALKAEFIKLARKRGGKSVARELFMRALKIVETGKTFALSNTQEFDARIFLPAVPKGFCERFDLPLLARNIDKLELLNSRAAELNAAGMSAFDIHNELQHVWQNGVVKPPQAPKVVALALDDSKNQIKHTVKYCGDVIWPRESLKHVSYKDLNMGWHIADHLLKYFEVAKPQKPNEVLVEVMQLVQDLRAASSLTGVTDTMMACAQAYAKRNQRADKADLSDGFPPGKPR
jgi:hypothetical protein